MPHPFKGRSCTFKGKAGTVLRGANRGDIVGREADFAETDEPHFLVQFEDGSKAVVPSAQVKIAKVSE